MTLLQVFLKTNDLGLELSDFLYKVSSNTSTRGNRSFILEQQGIASNSSQDVEILCLDKLLGLAHGNIAFWFKVVLMSK
jgi:hypothetical protein